MTVHFELMHLVILVSFLLLVEGFFSGSEIALLSADKVRLKESAKTGDALSARAFELATHPERVLSTTLLMTSLCVISISSLLTLFLLSRFEAHGEWLAIACGSPLVVIFGELIPKTLFQRNADRLARWVSFPVHLSYFCLYPLTRVLASYTLKLSRFVGPIEELISGKRKTTRENLSQLLTYNRKETEINSFKQQIIRRIFKFCSTEAKSALLPLVDVDAIEGTATIQLALESFERHRHSRMPVFEGRIDNIIGVLEIADLVNCKDLEQEIKHYTTPPRYVAETQSLEDIMMEMRHEDDEMVIVVDEHGGAIGILTFEDIVEEIVGEISDEYDYDLQPFKVLSERVWSIQAKMEIQQINEILKFELPEGDYKTLSGFLLQQFGRIPDVRDELIFDTPTGTFRFIIQKCSERHIETVLVEQL